MVILIYWVMEGLWFRFVFVFAEVEVEMEVGVEGTTS